MIDHTMDPMPERADPNRHGTRGGRTWFSRSTIYGARHYVDVPWARIILPAVAFLALALFGQFAITGEWAALARLVGVVGFLVGLNGIVWKAFSNPRHLR